MPYNLLWRLISPCFLYGSHGERDTVRGGMRHDDKPGCQISVGGKSKNADRMPAATLSGPGRGIEQLKTTVATANGKGRNYALPQPRRYDPPPGAVRSKET